MKKNISKISIYECTGCGACFNKCKINAINMEYNNEGFLYPSVNNLCINCGACLDVCPVEHPITKYITPPAYAVWADDEIRLQSSSGGMFTLLANKILDLGGIVCGAKYSDDFYYVYHSFVDNKKDISKLRGSKYVQSEIRDTYRQTEYWLKLGRYVLYTGCPCQIAGLYNFLGKKYDFLYTVDLICHGSNSLFAYHSFLKEFTDGKPIKKVDFRDKKFFSWSTPTVVYLHDGTVKKAAWNEGYWYKGFLEGVITRHSCSTCKFACAERISDITLGDCWQVHRINPDYDDRKGTSLVLVNSEKGNHIFHQTMKYMKLCKEIPLDEIRKYNPQLNHPTKSNISRKFFFSHLEEMGYHKALWYGRGMRFDFGIVGWWFASNYGSSLTYYALGCLLSDLNKQIILIPIAKINDTPWEKETKQTIDFLSKYFRVAKERKFDKMFEFNHFCDAFMLGSDQLWTKGALDLIGYSFFLDFVDLNKKKIAFSTSFGHDNFLVDNKTLDIIKDFILRFDAISVREESGKSICKQLFNLDVEQIIDPVFLCDNSHYKKLIKNININTPKKYILCYILDPSPLKEQIVKKIAKYMNYEVITILGMKEYSYAIDKWKTGIILPKITTEEFLYYIYNSSLIITDSHHGTCFAIIFEKQYIAFVNEYRGKTRFETVANLLDLKDRLVYDLNNLNIHKIIDNKIDYAKINKKLNFEIDKGVKWLKKSFMLPSKENYETQNTLNVKFFREVSRIKDSNSIINRLEYLEKKVNFLEEKINLK